MLRFPGKCNKSLLPKPYGHLLQSLSRVILISNFSSSSSSRNCLIKQQNTSTIKDLIVSCGIRPSTKPISTVTYFKSFGFSDTQIKSIITRAPSILFSNVSRIHKPKFGFLRSIGLSKQDVIKVINSDPYVLWRSLHNHLIPSFNLLKYYYGGQEIVVNRIKRRSGLFRCRILQCLAPNVKTLRDFGVPERRVVKMVAGVSSCLICANTKPHDFSKAVADVMDMGFDPSSTAFEHAVHAMAWQTKGGWLKKLKVYKSLGFSDGEICDMFKKQPITFWISEKKIRAAAMFYFEKFNWNSSHLVKYPNALMYSLDKRVVPRCSVWQVLVSRNKVRNVNILSLLTKTENEFLERYVNNYKDEIPEVLNAYQGRLNFDVFDFDLE